MSTEIVLPDLEQKQDTKKQKHVEYTRYTLPEPLSVHNVYKFVKVEEIPNVSVSVNKTLLFMFNQLDKISGDENRRVYITTIINFIVSNIKQLAEYPQIMVLLKIKFDDFIIKERMINLVPLYNKIYNDNLYDKVHEIIDNFEPVIPAEVLSEMALRYNETIKARIIQQNRKKEIPKYEVNDLVGARDREGKWRVAVILARFTYDGINLYYVDFPGYPSCFREFIVETKIEVFNPKKHKYHQRYIPNHATIAKPIHATFQPIQSPVIMRSENTTPEPQISPSLKPILSNNIQEQFDPVKCSVDLVSSSL